MDKITFPANKFEQFMVDSIKGYDDKTLVFVDGSDIRTAIAAAEFIKYNSSRLVFLGDEKIIKDNLLKGVIVEKNYMFNCSYYTVFRHVSIEQ